MGSAGISDEAQRVRLLDSSTNFDYREIASGIEEGHSSGRARVVAWLDL